VCLGAPTASAAGGGRRGRIATSARCTPRRAGAHAPGGSDEAALARALEDYDAALVNHGRPRLDALGETAESLEADWSALADELEEEDLPAGARVSIWSRSDFVVTHPERLIASARARYAELRPDDRPDEVDQEVPDVLSAVRELLHHEDHQVLGAYHGKERGLQPAGATTRILEVERALEDYPDDEWLFDEDFDPFDLDDRHG